MNPHTSESKRQPHSIPPQIVGVILAIAASASFAAMHNTIRYVTHELHPFEVAFFRNLFGVLFLVPWFGAVGVGTLWTRQIGTHVMRAAVNATSMLAWFSALSLMPVANATSLALIGPIFVAAGAVWFLGERITHRRWLGIAFAIGGALVIIRPGLTAVDGATLLVLCATLCVSTSKLIAKGLARTDSTSAIVAYLTFFMMPITLVPALFVWEWPSSEMLALLALIGAFGSTGHLLFIRAYKLADVSLVEPVMFTRMVWAALIGWFLFAEFVDAWTWVGAAIVVLGTTYLARREPAVRQHTGDALP
ncbi:MAG: DMT family transporter [Gemmatimonadota bacterium]|nr:MAG: DMT family transporter [Gemmatimonadota bacterium]